MQVRDILHIDDLCELIFANNQNKKINNLTLSFGGGLNNYSLKQLTKKLEKISKIPEYKIKQTFFDYLLRYKLNNAIFINGNLKKYK